MNIQKGVMVTGANVSLQKTEFCHSHLISTYARAARLVCQRYAHIHSSDPGSCLLLSPLPPHSSASSLLCLQIYFSALKHL